MCFLCSSVFNIKCMCRFQFVFYVSVCLKSGATIRSLVLWSPHGSIYVYSSSHLHFRFQSFFASLDFSDITQLPVWKVLLSSQPRTTGTRRVKKYNKIPNLISHDVVPNTISIRSSTVAGKSTNSMEVWFAGKIIGLVSLLLTLFEVAINYVSFEDSWMSISASMGLTSTRIFSLREQLEWRPTSQSKR